MRSPLLTAEEARHLVATTERRELGKHFEEIATKITSASLKKEFSTYWYYEDTAPVGRIVDELEALGYDVVKKSETTYEGVSLYLYIFWG